MKKIFTLFFIFLYTIQFIVAQTIVEEMVKDEEGINHVVYDLSEIVVTTYFQPLIDMDICYGVIGCPATNHDGKISIDSRKIKVVVKEKRDLLIEEMVVETREKPKYSTTAIEVNIFPNPFTSYFNVTLAKEEGEESFDFGLYSMSGQLIFQESRMVTEEENQLHFDLPNPAIPAAAYILRITQNGVTLHNEMLVKMSGQ